MRARIASLALLLAAASAGSFAQGPSPVAPADGAPSAELKAICAKLPSEPPTPRALATRAQCVLAGLIPDPQPYAKARELAREALRAGEPVGGFMLYVAWSSDPANSYMRNGKVDLEAYKKLAQRPMEERQEQAEAIDGLAYAASKGHINAGLVLVAYFHDTVAPLNIKRARAMGDLLTGFGERDPQLQQLQREAVAVDQVAAGTNASVRQFMDAYRPAIAAAVAGYKVQKPGQECTQLTLKSVSAGDVQGATYLPATSPLVTRSFLVRGEWPEFWTFDACGEDVPVKVTFTADGWGGATLTTAHNR